MVRRGVETWSYHFLGDPGRTLKLVQVHRGVQRQQWTRHWGEPREKAREHSERHVMLERVLVMGCPWQPTRLMYAGTRPASFRTTLLGLVVHVYTIHMRVHICICTCMHIYVYIDGCMYVYIYRYICMHVYIRRERAYVTP